MSNQFKEDKIEKIEKVGLSTSSGLQDKALDMTENSRVKFDEAYAKADPTKIQAEKLAEPQPIAETSGTQRPSLLDLASKSGAIEQSISPPTPQQVIDKAELTRNKFASTIETLQQNIDHTPTAPDRAAMTTSIQHVDRYLNQALSQVTGVETKTAIDVTSRPPLLRFLGLLTEGEKHLDGLLSGIKELHLEKNKLKPETLLGVQVRLGFVQTELEFFSNVLNKSLESTKTIMNVQI